MSALASVLVIAGCAGGPSVPDGDQMHISCLTQPEPGSCRGTKPGFYYDYQTDSCRRFFYGSCGARVPFATIEDCRARCGGRVAN
jgi:hypothetical protein